MAQSIGVGASGTPVRLDHRKQFSADGLRDPWQLPQPATIPPPPTAVSGTWLRLENYGRNSSFAPTTTVAANATAVTALLLQFLPMRRSLLLSSALVALLAGAPHAGVAASGQTVAAAPSPACSLVW